MNVDTRKLVRLPFPDCKFPFSPVQVQVGRRIARGNGVCSKVSTSPLLPLLPIPLPCSQKLRNWIRSRILTPSITTSAHPRSTLTKTLIKNNSKPFCKTCRFFKYCRPSLLGWHAWQEPREKCPNGNGEQSLRRQEMRECPN